MSPILQPPVRLWECPSCGLRHRSQDARIHVPVHPCKALRGLNVPFVEAGPHGIAAKARHRLIDREDYVNGDHVQTDGEGRPVAAVRTERPDGSYDTRVYAPTATGRAEVHGE